MYNKSIWHSRWLPPDLFTPDRVLTSRFFDLDPVEPQFPDPHHDQIPFGHVRTRLNTFQPGVHHGFGVVMGVFTRQSGFIIPHGGPGGGSTWGQ